MAENKKSMTPTEICQIAGISKNTLLRWEREGLIPKAHKDWRGWRAFTDADLEKVLSVKRNKASKHINEGD